ncbi:DUF362 domain-containing protein [Pseudothermotoga thermarum]|uniref:4Fe-4S ferredoxin-type domain-containing protein n=1 Tax=Pseudothermotoga thermarum DSM 5069 TaxID=688269 RepID=F7YX08_9THEM|nr:DUF362 domain-containing protein [Pseudothermotoga thermarum]AEH50603.1 hypothetical protein Theth_0514 [Pseudothermotoga thermarum DSM 5069]
MIVHFIKCEDYQAVEKKLLPVLEGYSSLFSPGEKVLVKPNLLSARKPEEAVATHPKVVEVVLRFLKDLGIFPYVGDSPAYGSLQKVLQVSGIWEVCQKLSVPAVELNEPVEVDGQRYKKIRISSKVFDFDKVVNVAKLKTHSQMVLTLAVKNLFGCVPGIEKSGWHIRCETNENFAALLVDICLIVNPVLSIVDGVEGMEGNGPANGKKKKFGVIVVSSNPFALDHAICLRLNVDPFLVYTVRESIARGLVKDYSIDGDWSSSIELPVTVPSLPVKGPLRQIARMIVRVPKISKKECIRCKICEEKCPAKAIDLSRSDIDYKKCIRCYVCHEVCPRGAIELVRRIFI